jgi:hypothetical protein
VLPIIEDDGFAAHLAAVDKKGFFAHPNTRFGCSWSRLLASVLCFLVFRATCFDLNCFASMYVAANHSKTFGLHQCIGEMAGWNNPTALPHGCNVAVTSCRRIMGGVQHFRTLLFHKL